MIPSQSELSKGKKFQVQTHGLFFPFLPPLLLLCTIFSKKFGLINYSGGNYNPLVLLQSPSEELRVLYKYELINCPSSAAGERQPLSSEAGTRRLPGWGCRYPGARAWAAWSPLWDSHLPEVLKAKGCLVPASKGIKLSSKIRTLCLALLQATPTGNEVPPSSAASFPP